MPNWDALPNEVQRTILSKRTHMMKWQALKGKTSQDVSKGVWLELENEEYGWWILFVSEGLTKGLFYFANNLETFSAHYDNFKLTLWNNGTIDRFI